MPTSTRSTHPSSSATIPPVIVGGGVVLAASYEAKAYGVRTAMGGRQAKQLCPHAIVVPPRMSAYTDASAAVSRSSTTPLPWSNRSRSTRRSSTSAGGPRLGYPVQIGARLREQVLERAGLPITVGIARTKFLAKVASQEAKPDGLLLVPPDRELAFLHPLPVRRLWGVGAKTAEKLHAHGIKTVADVAELSEATLGSMVGGGMGHQLFALSHNIDRRRVVTGVRRRSVGAQRALGRAGNNMSHSEIDGRGDEPRRPHHPPDAQSRTHRSHRRLATAVRRLQPGHPIPHPAPRHPVDRCHPRAARLLVAAAAPLIAERGLTLVGFAVSNIDREGTQQLELPFASDADPLAIDVAMDEVRQRFGNAAVMPRGCS